MMAGARAVRVLMAVLIGSLVAVVSPLALAAPTTYGGVTFPQGDLAFADRVVSFREASCVRCAFSDPRAVLGPPDCGAPGCVACGRCDPCSISLGFRLSEIDARGDVVVEFVDNRLVDVPGPDLFIYTTNDRPGRVEISTDGVRFLRVGETKGYPGAIDIAPFANPGEEFRFVRLSDVPGDEDKSPCPGPSIDAVGAMGPVREEVGEALGALELLPAGELALSVGPTAQTLLVLLDTSSSMGDPFEGSIKIEIAKKVLGELVDSIPDGTRIGLRTFNGCDEASRLLVPIGPIDRTSLQAQIRAMEPGGATAIAYALEQTKLDFGNIPDAKLVLLVSDGSETCRGNPVAVAKALVAAGYDLRIDVVGFDVGGDAVAREQLRAIAEATGGTYFGAQSTEELRSALRLSVPIRYHVYDAQGVEAFTGILGEPGPHLPAGTYRVVIDTVPPLELPAVSVEAERTTTIALSRTDGGYSAEVKK